MPIYEYQCKKCDKIFELFQKIPGEPTQKCKLCSGEGKKIISSSRFILKGAGFYVNDYPSESRKKGMESENNKFKPKSDQVADKPKKSGSEVVESSTMA